MSEPLILLPLDGTVHSRAAIPVAAVLGGILGAALRVIHVGDNPPPSLSKLSEQLGLRRGEVHRWSIDARIGKPSDEIVNATRTLNVRLIVMCTHTAVERPRSILGRTALQVLKTVSCPVVLVSPAGHWRSWRPNRILLPHDGSPTASAVIGLAEELGGQASGELIVVQVGSACVSTPSERGSLSMPLYLDQPQHEWPNWAEELLRRLACAGPDRELRAHLYVRTGEPGSEIVRMAEDQSVDLIMLAWKGEWAKSRAETLKKIIGYAPCPVLIVHA